jgi:hypothetical protein
MWWLAGASASILIFLVAATGSLIPLQSSDAVEYLFVQPSPGRYVLAAGASLALLVLIYAAVVRRARGRAGALHHEARSGRWLAPCCLSGGLALGILPAVPWAGAHAAVVGYFLYDLRWWWLAGLLAIVLARADRLAETGLGGRFMRLMPRNGRPHPVIAAAAIFLIAVGVATATTPHLRFSARLHGDEPRYLRYCELWYEGEGLDVSRVGLVAEHPTARPALGGNLVHLARALRVDARALAQDIRAASRHPRTFRWNRATAEDGFVHGIHGGLYQIHQPGISVVLFPGYFLDRYLIAKGASPDGKFPDRLPMTNLAMLVTFGAAAVALFRLLAAALGSEAWAFAGALAGTLTLPAAAFAFQFYPELPVLVIVLAVTRLLWFCPDAPARTIAVGGAAAGSLAWFHPRFLLLGGGFLVLAWMRLGGRRRLAFGAAFAAGLLSLMAYDYHVTGSWLPTALWDATGEGISFTDPSVIFNAIGYGIDRTWGVLPHTPVLVFALPGLLLLARRSPGQAIFIAAMTAALVLTAAGHTLSAAGTTPDRLILAVVPLLIWPAMLVVRQCWQHPALRALAVILAVMSLHTAIGYNLHHEKAVGPLREASAVGWAPNLAFPITRGEVWSTSMANFWLYLGVFAAMAVVTLWGWRASRAPSLERARPHPWRAAGLTMAALVGGLTIATSANGDWNSRAFLQDRDAARLAAVEALVAIDRCVLCSTSTGSPVSWTNLEPNAAASASLSVDARGRAIQADVTLDRRVAELAFGRMRLEFGDGTTTPWLGIVGRRTVPHVYTGAGLYQVRVALQLPTGDVTMSGQDVVIH